MWHISNDLWDRWEDIKTQFENCQKWTPHSGPGCWPDADMLPLGHIGIRAERGVDRWSLLTKDEQITLMTLWTISRSPLMFGGDLPSSDEFSLSLIANDEVLAVNQNSCNNREIYRYGTQVVWAADIPNSPDKYLALFNIGEVSSALIEINIPILGEQNKYEARDL